MQGGDAEVQSMAAKGMPRCAQHAAEGLPRCAAWLRGAVAVAAWLPRCCRDEHQGCEGMPRCAARLRGAAAVPSMAAEVLPRCEARPRGAPRCCRDEKQGCEGLPMCAEWLRGAVAVAAWLPRECRVQGSIAAEGLSKIHVLMKIHFFHFL